nr:immunoglobulin heavy chain junction region [Macaca mulatta]MOW49559.1 immunoglobulin heavy chain junction region [Macaca mulatta]
CARDRGIAAPGRFGNRFDVW